MQPFRLLPAIASLPLTFAAYAAAAQGTGEVVGAPVPNGIGFQPAATELARDLHWLDNFLLVIITVIVIFVVALLGIVIIRYNRTANPEPARFTHHTPVEVVWTVLPILILLAIMVPSLGLLYKQQVIPKADVTIKATGFQWFWEYEYVDDGISFSSFMLGDREDLPEYGYDPKHYLLATDTRVVIPVGKTIVVQVTAADVIHSWTIPAFGVKQDGIPGRVAELWFKAEREGIYFGQCSELCGKDHSYMPITVEVVSEEAYQAWIAEKTAALDASPAVQIASLK